MHCRSYFELPQLGGFGSMRHPPMTAFCGLLPAPRQLACDTAQYVFFFLNEELVAVRTLSCCLMPCFLIP